MDPFRFADSIRPDDIRHWLAFPKNNDSSILLVDLLPDAIIMNREPVDAANASNAASVNLNQSARIR